MIDNQQKYDAYEADKRIRPRPPTRAEEAFDAVRRFLGKALAVLVGLAVGGGTIYGVWQIWPHGVADIPLAAITLKQLSAIFVSVVAGAFGLSIAWAIVMAALEEI
jgi:hypothetical protein